MLSMRRRAVLRAVSALSAWTSAAVRGLSLEEHPYQALQQQEEPPRTAAAKRETPGFARQLAWCLGRAALQRSREPRAVFLSYAIIALTGAALAVLQQTWP